MKHILSEIGAAASPRDPGGDRAGSGREADPLVLWGRMACAGIAWYEAWTGLWFNMAQASVARGFKPAVPDPETVRQVMTPPPELRAIVIPFVPRARQGRTRG